MTNLPAEIIENGIRYTLHGDYYFPDITIPKKEIPSIGRYALMRKAYLQEYRPRLYHQLLASGKLVEHLTDVEHVCSERLERIIPQMARCEFITEALKAKDQMAWVAGMNSIRQRAEELVLTEIVYS